MRNEGWFCFGREFVGRIWPTVGTLLLASSLSAVAEAAAIQFLQHTDYPASPQPFSIATGDLNNDTHPDLIVGHGGGGMSVYFGLGNGGFSAAVPSVGAGFGRNIVLANLNSDPWLDPVMADEGGYVLLYSGAESGAFNYPYRLDTPGPEPSHVAVGDLDTDGDLDVAVTNWGNPGTVGIHLGKGDGTLDTAVTYQTLPGPRGIAIADFNGDSNLDLVVAIEGYTGVGLSHVSVLPGTGTGTFGPHTDYGVDFTPEGVAVGDLNGDQKPDIVTAGQDGKVAVLLNNGSGGFGPKTEYSAGGWHFSVALADFNGDGLLDIVTPDAGFYYDVGRIATLYGVGDGTFEDPIYHDTWFGPITVAVDDLNHDGLPDLAVATFGDQISQDNYISVLLNCGPCVPTAIEVALIDARSDESGVHIRWSVDEPNGSTAILERKSENGDWGVQMQFVIMGPTLEVHDSDVSPGQRYAYRLIIHDPDGTITTPELWVQAAGQAIPRRLVLETPVPNPSGGAIRASVGLPGAGNAELTVFDVSGRLVARLAEVPKSAGWHQVTWDGRDRAGRAVATGTYFLRLTAGSTVTRRFVVLR